MSKPEFINLHNHSHHGSLLDGYSTNNEYFSRAAEIGQKGLGMTDHGTLHGTYDFIQTGKDYGITPVPGIEAYMAPIHPDGAQNLAPTFYAPEGTNSKNDVASRGAYLHLTIWAYNNTGLHNLFKLSTLSNDPSRVYRKPRMDFNMLAEHSDGLIVSTGCPSSEISTRFLLGQDDKAYEYAGRLKEVFGERLFVEIMDHDMSIDLERNLLPKQLKLSKDLGIPLLATNDSHYAHQENSISHEEMLCAQSGAKMSDKTYDEGGSRFAFQGNQYYLKSAEEMSKIFPDKDFPNALSNSLLIAEMATDISLDYNPNLMPKPVVPSEFKDAVEYYKHLLQVGMKERYGNAPKETKAEAIRRSKHEFQVLHSSNFIDYMLVVYEYLKWTKDNYSIRDEAGKVLASSIGTGRGCFLPGNKVKIGNINRNIENIAEIIKQDPNKKVMTHDGSKQIVEDVFEYAVNDADCVELTFADGTVIRCTSDHRIFMKDTGFVEAGELSIGDTVIGPKTNNQTAEIECVNCRKTYTRNVKGLRRALKVSSYKKEGEYYCTTCANKNIHKIPAVQEGLIKGAAKNQDPAVREKNRQTHLLKWADPEYKKYRNELFSEFAKTEEYREACRKRNKKRYANPVELKKLLDQGRAGYKRGIFKSGKVIDKLIKYDSSYELKALNIFETDSEVSFFDRSDDVIPYVFNGNNHIYYPDFSVQYLDGNKKVIEVKAEWDTKLEKTQAKIKAAKKHYSSIGIIYEVWTEKELELLNDSLHNNFEITNIRRFKYTGKVYDLQVANTRNYTVNNITVHNSVGGSIHAYLLGISEVCPIDHDLIFERFLSAGRGATYRLTYDDGTTEEMVVSTEKKVLTEDGNEESKYIHQLKVGDTLVDNVHSENE